MRRRRNTSVIVMQEFGNTLVALGMLRSWFVWTQEIDDVEIGCTCGYCRISRIHSGVSYTTNDGEYFEWEKDDL